MTVAKAPLSDAEARRLIATALDTTLIVEAAAGTGKTTALVERIVRMVAEGGAAIDAIVAVTFTEKAAGELKLRLRERLDGARHAAAPDSDQRARLDKALTQLEEAHVGTIHAFCAELLRERPVEAGVDPLFEVLTEPASARLFDEAFARWLQDELEHPAEGIRRALRRSAFGGEDGPVDRLRKAAWELAQWRDFTGAWSRPAFDRDAAIGALVARLREVADLTRDPASKNDPLWTGTEPVRRLSDEIGLQQTFGDAGPRDVLYHDGWEAGLVDLSRDRVLTGVKQGRGSMYRDGIRRDHVWEALTSLRAELDQFRMDADADLAALLQQALKAAIARYEQMKAKAGALDFLDLLLVARNLVRDNRQVREVFQGRFTRIFVDEFQDTDPLQAEILLLLAAADPAESDWRSARPAPGRLFLVGDPKQSIYRFRRADVAVYRDVCRQLEACGATRLHLTTSFRSVPGIQAFVNAAFAPVMTGDDLTLQADYVPLGRDRPALPGQPAIVALPVPEPYARKYVSGRSIEQSLPGAVGAFVDWIVNHSNWQVTERTGAAPVKVAAKHICLLFRRFVSWETDVTRAYVEALEARAIPHVLVGGRAFHEREEVEALRAALTAIEWPDDELSVFATLRGPFFAIGDEELLEWAYRFGHQDGDRFRRGGFHPFRVPRVFDDGVPPEIAHLVPIADALRLLQRLHRHRNYVQRTDTAGGRISGGVSGTLQELLAATRAHVGFALRTGGEQALANVLHIGELARQYEMNGGISFRGFVDELRIAAETAQASEAPILEEDSDGVRMMTVHKAKGLEFPIVILADMTCRLSRPDASRWIDPSGRVCALKLGGWAPTELLLHGYEGGWLDPLMPAVYPSLIARAARTSAPGCPEFTSKDSVLVRPEGDPARPTTVAPGMYASGPADAPDSYAVVWWDPRALALTADAGYGLRRDDLIAKDGDAARVEARRDAYQHWRTERDAAVVRASAPSVRVQTATALAGADAVRTAPPVATSPSISVVDLARSAERPFGARFGTLVHAVLATAPLDASERTIDAVAQAQARILPAALKDPYAEEEVYAAVEVVTALLASPLFDRIRRADAAGRCHRELPITWKADDGTLVEGTIDLTFEDDEGMVVIDFKTDRELSDDLTRYTQQLDVYCRALGAVRGGVPEGILLKI